MVLGKPSKKTIQIILIHKNFATRDAGPVFPRYLKGKLPHIEEVHYLFCAHLIILFFILWVVLNLDIFFPFKMLRGCVVCVFFSSNSFHFWIFKLCIMLVHTLQIFTSYFVHIWYFIIFLGVLNFDTITSTPPLGCLHCNVRFRSFIFKHCILIPDILKLCTFYFVSFWYIISHIFF